MFDVMVKRLHEYKRQLLKALHIIHLYQRLKVDPAAEQNPVTFVFGAKAAPGYHMAKLIIKLINCIADVVNRDPVSAERLRVVFIPNFNVTSGQLIYPAADISEQISLAGKEASGTGNMKFALNGALTVGTLDGANVEIREKVGAENFFLFGLTTDEVFDAKARGYNPHVYIESNAALRDAIDWIACGQFSGGDTEIFRPIVDSLLYHDEYMLWRRFCQLPGLPAAGSGSLRRPGEMDDYVHSQCGALRLLLVGSNHRGIQSRHLAGVDSGFGPRRLGALAHQA